MKSRTVKAIEEVEIVKHRRTRAATWSEVYVFSDIFVPQPRNYHLQFQQLLWKTLCTIVVLSVVLNIVSYLL